MAFWGGFFRGATTGWRWCRRWHCGGDNGGSSSAIAKRSSTPNAACPPERASHAGKRTHPKESVVDAIRLGRVEESLQTSLARADHSEHRLGLVAHEAPIGEADVGADGLDGLGERLGLLELHLRALRHLFMFF